MDGASGGGSDAAHPTPPTAKENKRGGKDRQKWEDAYDKSEQALMKPSLPGSTHVLNLMMLDHFEEVRRQEEQQKRKDKEQRLRDRQLQRELNGPPWRRKAAEAARKKREQTGDTQADGLVTRGSGSTGSLGATQPAATTRAASPPPPSTTTGRAPLPPRSVSVPPPSPTRRSKSPLAPLPLPTPAGLSTVEFSALLTKVNPPVSFQGQVRGLCNVPHTDIGWVSAVRLKGFDAVPSTLLTVDTLQDDLWLRADSPTTTAGRHVTLLNSPRSVVCVMRCGVGPMEVQRRPLRYFLTTELGDPVVEDVARLRHSHHEQAARRDMATLKAEYDAMKEKISFTDVINFFQQYDPSSSLSTTIGGGGDKSSIIDRTIEEEPQWVTMRKAKRDMMMTAMKSKVAKEIERAAELQEKAKAAAASRKRIEEEQKQRAAAKQQDLLERKAASRAKTEAWRAHMATTDAKHLQELLERRTKMEARESVKQQMIEERREIQRAQVEKSRQQNDLRMEEHRKHFAAEMEKRVARLEEKEKAAEVKRLQMEATAARAAELSQERSAKVQEHQRHIQEEFQSRALKRKEDLRARQAQAEDALNRFLQQQAEERERIREADAQAEERRKGVIQAGRTEAQQKREERLAKQEMQYAAFLETKRQREHEKVLSHTDSALRQEDKLVHVARQHRVRDFQKLCTVHKIYEKQHRIEAQQTMREELEEDDRMHRDKLRLEKEVMLETLAAEYHHTQGMLEHEA